MERLKRRRLIAALAVLCLLACGAASLFGQTVPPTDPCTDFDPQNPGQYAEVDLGKVVTICFEYPEADFPHVKFFRVRWAQQPAGGYFEWFRVKPAQWQTHFYFQFPADRDRQIFLTTVWDEPQPDGTTVTRESPGSSHAQIKIRTATPVQQPQAAPDVSLEEGTP